VISKGTYKQKTVRVSNVQRSLSGKAISKGTYKKKMVRVILLVLKKHRIPIPKYQ
jgi:hypothetical protein